jgi:hypothetical protein
VYWNTLLLYMLSASHAATWRSTVTASPAGAVQAGCPEYRLGRIGVLVSRPDRTMLGCGSLGAGSLVPAPRCSAAYLLFSANHSLWIYLEAKEAGLLLGCIS